MRFSTVFGISAAIAGISASQLGERNILAVAPRVLRRDANSIGECLSNDVSKAETDIKAQALVSAIGHMKTDMPPAVAEEVFTALAAHLDKGFNNLFATVYRLFTDADALKTAVRCNSPINLERPEEIYQALSEDARNWFHSDAAAADKAAAIDALAVALKNAYGTIKFEDSYQTALAAAAGLA